MLNQRDVRWSGEIMGFGDVTLGGYGCYLVSLCQGLMDRGWDLNPHTFNQELKNRELFIRDGKTNNYIDVGQLANKWPDIFVKFSSVIPYNDVPALPELVNDSQVVLCRVDAKGIGGLGSHFVLLKGFSGKTAIVGDPWTGTEDLVTKRYGTLGNILDLRIFDVKKKIINQNEEMITDTTKIDMGDGYGLQEVQAIRSTIHDQAKTIVGQNQAISNLQAQVLDLTQQVGSLDAQVKTIKGLNAKISDLESQVSQWQEAEKTWNRSKAQLEQQIAVLQSANPIINWLKSLFKK